MADLLHVRQLPPGTMARLDSLRGSRVHAVSSSAPSIPAMSGHLSVGTPVDVQTPVDPTDSSMPSGIGDWPES